MKFKIRFIEKYYAIVNFAFEADFMKKHSEFCFYEGNYIDYFEEVFLAEEIYLRGYILVQSLKFNYHTKEKTFNGLIIGSVKLILIENDFVDNFPSGVKITYSDKDNEETSRRYIEEEYKDNLLRRKLYYEVNIDTSIENSIIYYDLVYKKNGNTINSIPNLKFDMTYDDDLNKELLLNCSINDQILIDKGEIDLFVVINRVSKKIPYSVDNYDPEALKKYGFKTLQEYKDFYFKSARYIIYIDSLLYLITKSFLEITNFQAGEQLLELVRNQTIKPPFLDIFPRNENIMEFLFKKFIICGIEEDLVLLQEEFDELQKYVEMMFENEERVLDYTASLLAKVLSVKYFRDNGIVSLPRVKI